MTHRSANSCRYLLGFSLLVTVFFAGGWSGSLTVSAQQVGIQEQTSGDSTPVAPDSPVGANESDEEAASDQTTAKSGSSKLPPWMQNVDTFFGEYLVRPLNAVLFFPLYEKSRQAEETTYQFTLFRLIGVGSREATAEELDAFEENNQNLTKLGQPPLEVDSVAVPFIVLWLFGGAVFFTLRMGFINIRGFWHALRLTKGDYDNPHEKGEVSHFQALASALSATVGLGNIAGVAIAIGSGGPGAAFWIAVVGLLGMSTKFAECTLGQLYRKISPDGVVSGGPMQYLKDGLSEMKLGFLGSVLAILFSLICIGASLGGGNAFQVGQSLGAIREDIGILDQFPWIYGIVMAVMVGIVIIGGIRSIGAVAGRIVPFMCGAYVLTSLYIIFSHSSQIPDAFSRIFEGAFSAQALYGGFLGVLVIGVTRAVFSNEAGAGSAAIAHSAAKTDEPVSEGIVALLEPFIDTVVVCTMTALVIIITGVYDGSQNETYNELIAGKKGAALTAEAFKSGGFEWFKYILYTAVVLFAYSTLISWSYYGERCWCRLFSEKASIAYKVLFLVFVVLGSIVTEGNVLAFSDLLILGMAFPNVLGVILLSGKVKQALDEYWDKYKTGKIAPVKKR